MKSFLAVTTALVVVAIGLANVFLDGSSAFVAPNGAPPQLKTSPQGAVFGATQTFVEQPFAAMRSSMGVTGLLAFGMGFGILASLARSSGRVSMRAEGEIAVAEKEPSTLELFDKMPRTLLTKSVLDRLLALTPKDQWEDPAEGSQLWYLKVYAETYGEGKKSTKMGWWDFWYYKVFVQPDETQLEWMAIRLKMQKDAYEMWETGQIPLRIPGPAPILFDTGAKVQWRGAEPFAGDQVKSPVTDSLFAKQYLKAMAFYRDGLKPWQRGLEIGMAHGYFLIGPFTSLGPLRNTPEAATVGLLCGCAIVGIVSTGGLIFGTTIKPTLFDKPGDKPAAGFQEMINWHAVGGLGGAGFAHALITVFGS